MTIMPGDVVKVKDLYKITYLHRERYEIAGEQLNAKIIHSYEIGIVIARYSAELSQRTELLILSSYHVGWAWEGQFECAS